MISRCPERKSIVVSSAYWINSLQSVGLGVVDIEASVDNIASRCARPYQMLLQRRGRLHTRLPVVNSSVDVLCEAGNLVDRGVLLSETELVQRNHSVECEKYLSWSSIVISVILVIE